MRKFLTLSMLMVTSACTSLGFAVVNLPSSINADYKLYQVAYDAGALQKLDIYVPKKPAVKPFDVIVFLYGGRWETGVKENYRFVGSRLAEEGFIVVIPDYRKYPQVKFPVFVQDGAKALAWTYDHIDSYGGRPDHINLAGHSSGAHIAALLTADKSYLKAENKDANTVIRSFAGLSGPYAFTPDEPDLKAMFGPPENYPKMQAPTFIDGTEPPMLLQYGLADDLVGKINHEKLARAIEDHHGSVQVKLYPGLDHIDMVKTFSWTGPKSSVIQDMVAFFRKNAATVR